MGKYFGTDGIRGEVNKTLDAQMAFKVGQYLGYYFSQQGKPKILIGRDTRLSGEMLEMSIASGIMSVGGDVYLLGVCPTPCVAYIVKNQDFSCGVMISASHNPYYDNGIKVFSHDGVKLDSSIEDLVEQYLDGKSAIELAKRDCIGTTIHYKEGLECYLGFLAHEFSLDLTGMNIALDCANGSSTTSAVQLLSRFNCKLSVMANTPDGININTDCGSTHPSHLQEMVKNGNFDLGLAFDGDADRLIAIDERGELITGDHILYVGSKYLRQIGELKHNTVVTTVMANLGLFKALKEASIQSVVTQVGDKYVFDEMNKNDYSLGGEQSGHIILREHLTTGDGLLTGLLLLKIMTESKKKMSELCQDLHIFPQLLINVPVSNKEVALHDERLLSLVDSISKELGEDGRILVRPSGTEPLIRVMVEAETQQQCHDYVYRVVDFIKATF